MASLQDQLLKAGLADKKSAKQARADKRKKQKQKTKNQPVELSDSQLAAQKVAEEKKERDRLLNEEQNKEREKRSVIAQVKQLISINIQPKGKGDQVLNFTHENVIKRMYVSVAVHKLVTQGRLTVVAFEDGYELVPTPVADKIAQRDEASIVYRADDIPQSEQDSTEDDDWYAEFQIPDDLSW